MNLAIESFRASAVRVRHLGALYQSLQSLFTPAVDSTDLLRAQLVLAVSALDYFVHELTVQGLNEVVEGVRPATDAFKKYKTSCEVILHSENWKASFEKDIRERHSFLSFQQPEKIADAIRLFWAKPLWRAVAARMSKNEDSVKAELRLVVERRNKIAHEADIDPSFPGARWPITMADCNGAITLVESVCEAIYAEVKL